MWDPVRPFNDIPLLPPSTDIETKGILKKTVTARAALAELKQAALLIPNQSILINTLPLLEAQASSEIENIVTTNDALFRYSESMTNADPATKEALRYRTAVFDGFRRLSEKPLCTSLAEAICSVIKDREMRVRKVPGTELYNERENTVIYTPPEGEPLLRRLCANWERFLHEEKAIDPLVRMAVGHYQFESIHPFTDGNGRAGRILNTLFLIEEGLLTLPILYLSRFIIALKNDYYRLLLDVTRQGSWEQWILFILEGVEQTAGWTIAKIAAIRSLAEHTGAYVKARLPALYSRELIDLIFEQPYCRIGSLVKKDLVKRQTASEYLKKLAEAGILEERQTGREKLFIHSQFFKLLTEDENRFRKYGQE